MVRTADSNRTKAAKKIIWNNLGIFERIEFILKQRAVDVYTAYFQENNFSVSDIPESELLKMGESEINSDLVEKITMSIESIYKHSELEKILKKQEITIDELKDGLNFYSTNIKIVNPFRNLTDERYESLAIYNNLVMVLHGIGQLKGFLYSQKCSKSQNYEKPCFFEWCEKSKNNVKCPLKKQNSHIEN